MTERQEMEAVIEAILFVAQGPVGRDKLMEVFDEPEREAAAEALESVLERYQERPEKGVMLDEVAGGLRLVTRPDLHGYLRRFFEVTGRSKLTMAALETLAIIAYRQPMTSPEIQELRNVNPAGVLKKLLERRLIRIAGRKEVVGKPFLYSTTREFLQHFGLKSLKELPPLEQFEELFGSDVDVEPAPESVEPDQEEELLREAAEIEDREGAVAEAAEREEIEEEREAAEIAEDIIDPDAVEPEASAAAVTDQEPDREPDASDSTPRTEGPAPGLVSPEEAVAPTPANDSEPPPDSEDDAESEAVELVAARER